jgi:hypothetical protein
MTTVLQDAGPRARLLEETGSKARLCENVDDFSLDPDVYLAVIEAELGRSGKVNRNGRIYPANEFIRENESLARRLDDEFVDGELGHPPGGPTFEVPARLLEIALAPESDSVVTAVGRFGLLNTASGRDVLTLFRAGMPVGVSSRGEGVLEQITIEEGGPFAGDNPEHVGQTVGLVSDFSLDRYDLVRVPSAGTHLRREETSSSTNRDAAPELEVTMSDQEKRVVKEADQEVQPSDPAAVNDATAKILESDPLFGLSDNQKGVLLRIVEGITCTESADDDQIASEISALREQLEVDRHRATINEAEYASLKEEVASLRAEREERRLRDALESEKTETTSGRRFGPLVSEQIDFMVAEGAIVNVEGVTKNAERLFALLEAATVPVAQPVAQEPQDAGDDPVEAPDAAVVVESSPEDLNDIMESVRATMARDRQNQIGG